MTYLSQGKNAKAQLNQCDELVYKYGAIIHTEGHRQLQKAMVNVLLFVSNSQKIRLTIKTN